MVHKRLTRNLLALALVSALITTAYAYMVHRSQTIVNTFEPAKVSCSIEEKFTDSVKSEIKVVNTSTIDAYLRVRLVAYWEDSKGNKVARDMDFPEIQYDAENWYKVGDYTYYYRYPIAPQGETPNLLKQGEVIELNGVRISSEEDEDENRTEPIVYYEYYPVVEVLAEAIQSKPSTVITDSWGITPGENGILPKN